MQTHFHPNQIESSQETNLFYYKPKLLLATLVFLFLAAIVLRVCLYQIAGPPRIIAERQFRSAIMARSFYFTGTKSVPEWKKQVAATSVQRAGILEPPIMELLVSFVYRILGKELLWFARFFSLICWMIGGVFLFMIAKELVSLEAAVVSTTYFLFVPLGVIISLSFQPDALMIMMFLFGLYTMLLYYKQRSKIRLIITGVISGLAIFIKPFCLFALLGGFIALYIQSKQNGRHIASSDLLIFLAICLSLGTSYYVFSLFSNQTLAGQSRASFLLYLLVEKKYWKSWLLTAITAVGYTPLIAALLGFLLLPRGLPRALLIGLVAGYVIFCIVFTHHIQFAGYYHLQLIPIVALSLGPIIILIVNYLKKECGSWYFWTPAIAALFLVFLFNIREIRHEVESFREFESKEIAKEIGKIVEHSEHVVYVAPYYGMPLEYYGELSGTYWPRRIVNQDWINRVDGHNDKSESSWFSGITKWVSGPLDERELSIEERFRALDFRPDYFIITDFRRFNRQHSDIKIFLVQNCHIIAKSNKYLIYKIDLI